MLHGMVLFFKLCHSESHIWTALLLFINEALYLCIHFLALPARSPASQMGYYFTVCCWRRWLLFVTRWKTSTHGTTPSSYCTSCLTINMVRIAETELLKLYQHLNILYLLIMQYMRNQKSKVEHMPK